MTDWDELVESCGPMVFRVASRITGNGADAEDLVQTTFLEAYRLRQRKTVSNWPALLRRIVTHRAYDLLKKKRRWRSLEGEHESTSGPRPCEPLETAELIERLQAAVCQLPPQQASAFWLRYFESCTNEEIAEALGLSSHGVAVALNKARKKLAPQFCQTHCGRNQ